MIREHLTALHQRTLGPEIAAVQALCRTADPTGALLDAIDRWSAEARRVRHAADRLSHATQEASGVDRTALLATWLRDHAPTTALPGDLAALRRDLGLDAIQERATAAEDEAGARVQVALAALQGFASEQAAPDLAEAARRIVGTTRRTQTRCQALQLVSHLLATFDLPARASLLSFAERTLLDPALDPWSRRAAAGALVRAPARAEAVWPELTDPEAFLVRARIAEGLPSPSEGLLEAALDDPSELVRFTAVERIVELGLSRLIREAATREPRTRARLGAELAKTPSATAVLAGLVADPDPLVARMAVQTAAGRWRAETPPEPALVDAVRARVTDPHLPLRRAAERAIAWASLHAHPARALATELATLRDGERRRIVLPPGLTPMQLASALRPFAIEGFGFALRPAGRAVHVFRGDHDRFQLWRVLHELRSPAPAKRQGHTHNVGASLLGPIRVPPGQLAEQSATGVPGQRVQLADGDWFPEVPAVDDCRRALAFGEVALVTGSGTTVLFAPDGWWARTRARVRLAWRYGELDLARSAALSQHRPELWESTLTELGFSVRSPATPFLAYVIGTAQNTLVHLVILTVALWVLLMGANIWLRSRLKLDRRHIALVIGGWGTRGKSGTERLKAAVLKGAGVPFVSKTTGCEAMILHGPRGGRVRELFLFRPYDKATIWEQADVVRFAARSGARAMLYECMALNPRYVDVIQRGWMHDDLSTLTNAYPDHEDVMGPTGMDVARVIGQFCPVGTTLLTTEDNMYPVLAEWAGRRGARCERLSAADKELLPADLVTRFPYEEHPSNIALATRVASRLGVHPVEAMGWMAEHVIPDLGALMIYPKVAIDGREVTFVNGHSANDELSFTHSWRHTGFAGHTVDGDPDLWLIGVVNNRADRLPRSRVFARMAVRVAAAHAFLVIGTNLSGFDRMVDEAIDELLQGLRVDDPAVWAEWSARLKAVEPGAFLAGIGDRRPLDPDAVRAFVDAVHGSTGPSLDAARRALEAARPLAEAVDPELADRLLDIGALWLALRDVPEAPEARRALVRQVLARRIHRLDDANATGDEVVAAAVALAPPGARVRMMGMQNIKGTGLDFAYQWVFWRELHADLQKLSLEELERTGVQRLTSVFHCDALLAHLPEADSPWRRAIEARRADLLAARGRRTGGGPIGALRTFAWWIVDPFDAVLRRRRARRIFTDLAAARISHDRAQHALSALTKRQK